MKPSDRYRTSADKNIIRSIQYFFIYCRLNPPSDQDFHETRGDAHKHDGFTSNRLHRFPSVCLQGGGNDDHYYYCYCSLDRVKSLGSLTQLVSILPLA